MNARRYLIAGILCLCAGLASAEITGIRNPDSGGGSTPAGANGNIQFNNHNAFGADTHLSYSTSTHLIIISTGGIQWPDGTIQVSSPTSSAGTGIPGGSPTQLQYNVGGITFGGVTNPTTDGTILTYANAGFVMTDSAGCTWGATIGTTGAITTTLISCPSVAPAAFRPCSNGMSMGLLLSITCP